MTHLRDLCKLVLLALLGVSCALEKDGHAPVNLEEDFALSPADTIQFKDGGTIFWISLQEVQDSRCPEGANCITAGKATVVLGLEGQLESLILCQGADCSTEHERFFLFEYNSRKYTVVLQDVVPYPQTGREIEPKQTILKIKRTTG